MERAQIFWHYFALLLVLCHAGTTSKAEISGLVNSDEAISINFDAKGPEENGPENAFAPNSTEIVEEIMRLLELGEHEIELSEQSDIILVVGQTGSGKSTTTQFLAGENNVLEAVQNEDTGDFYIIDTDGTISNQTIISKTLLPDLVVERHTNTAFYDCPGFSDTRNESVEIANSFFIKKVADHGQRVKIAIVAHDSIMQSQDRTGFPDLLKQLAIFIKSMDKMTDGISIVGTNCKDHHKTDAQIVNTYAEKIKTVIRDLPSIWDGDEALAPALTLLNALLERNEEDTAYTRIGFFRTPAIVGPLDENPIFQGIKLYLKNLIWNNTNYVAKTEEDFGYSLSTKSYLLIGELATSIDRQIQAVTGDLSSEFNLQFERRFDAVLSGEENDLLRFKHTLLRLFGLTYDTCLGSSNLSPLVYMQELLENVYQLTEGSAIPVQEKLSNYSNYLEFLKVASVNNEITIYPNLWVSPLIHLNSSVYQYMEESFAPVIYGRAYSALEKLSSEVIEELISVLGAINDVYAKNVTLDIYYNQMKGIQTAIEDQLGQGDVQIQDFIIGLLDHFKSLDIPISQETIWEVEGYLRYLDLVDAGRFMWTEQQPWDTLFARLFSFVQDERLWNRFLINLMKDLSEADVQAFKVENYHLWWSQTGAVDLTNFNNFWTKFASINTIGGSDYDVVFPIVEQDPTAHRLTSLNLLLGTTLRMTDCSHSNGGTIVCAGMYIAMSDVLHYLREEQTEGWLEQIAIIGYHSFYYDESFIGTNFNTQKHIDVFIMSRTWWVREGLVLDLKTGAIPVPPPKLGGTGTASGIPGAPGFRSGNLFGIGQYFQGGDFVFRLEGGTGGRGQEGQDGLEGAPGPEKHVRSYNKDDCEYRHYHSTNELRVWIEPNRCGWRENTWYPSAWGGIPVEVFGEVGEGNAGNPGGAGGNGGSGGKALVINVQQPNPISIEGGQGDVGPGGKGGLGGPGGLRGNTRVYQCDDKWFQCEVVFLKSIPRIDHTTRGPTGPPGEGENYAGIQPPEPNNINPSQFVRYVQSYRTAYQDSLSTNEFLRTPLHEFLLNVDAHGSVPHKM